MPSPKLRREVMNLAEVAEICGEPLDARRFG